MPGLNGSEALRSVFPNGKSTSDDEYLRAVLVAARAACDATSGQRRFEALDALFDLVAATRHIQVLG